MKLLLSLSVLLILSTVLMPVWAESDQYYKKRPLDVRVDRLERLMGSQKQLELLYRMKQLQEENQQLRSLLEEQANELRLMKQQQRQLYTDLEHRLSRMEGGGRSELSMPVSQTSAAKASIPKALPPASPSLSTKNEVVMEVDKSSTAQAQYGVTEREEIIVSGAEQAPAMAKRPPIVKETYKKQSMSKKQRMDEQKMYQAAYDELRARRYNTARESFMGVIKKYPGGRYAHIAQYWVAESSYAQRNYEQAIQDYQLLLDYYPNSPKKAEAELKKAYSLYESGKKDLARKTLNHLLANYPDTTEAGQAKRLLKQL
ncbi:tol-pal system protein YbgF [sulfur-oxidizing endosymbiont of Gigantopelta aegis]|uniref:tol-pal system protein YbgF n=1 Tax=sulfur-oxidizing endosymbiont of Gigantopelta aegis TaxID=2794934 RepID=UPI0018DBCE73|nr:tol-pal system protein YbgF [sulfur-oxidizing endosymbiont of Gigantopelta aegis]